jgi:hypothetical protein
MCARYGGTIAHKITQQVTHILMEGSGVGADVCIVIFVHPLYKIKITLFGFLIIQLNFCARFLVCAHHKFVLWTQHGHGSPSTSKRY